MSDFSRLEDKLAKLRQRERGHGERRTLRGTTPDLLLAAIVTEIDETILPRRVTFTTASGSALHLAVANRRLQALLSPAPETSENLADVALKDAQDPNVAILREVLAKILSDQTELIVTSTRQTSPGFPSDVGVPSNILVRTWNLTETAEAPVSAQDALNGFLSGLGDRVKAWLLISGEEVVAEQGESEFLSEMAEQAALFLDGYFAKRELLFSKEPGPCAVAIAPSGTNGTAALYLDIGDQSAFIAVSTENLPALATDWQKVALSLG